MRGPRPDDVIRFSDEHHQYHRDKERFALRMGFVCGVVFAGLIGTAVWAAQGGHALFALVPLGLGLSGVGAVFLGDA